MKTFLNRINAFFVAASRKNLTAYASSAAFYFFLSFIPILILLIAIIPYTPISKEYLEAMLTDALPSRIDAWVVQWLDELFGKSPAIISVSAITTIWAASRGIYSLIRGLNAANALEETRNMFLLRCRSGIYTIYMLLLIIVMLLMGVFGDLLVNLLLQDFSVIQNLWDFIGNFRYLVVVVMMTLLFASVFAKLPNHNAKIKSQLPGAFFTAVSWAVFSYLFSVYVERFNAFSMYGSLTTIIILLLWLYMLMFLLLLGAQLNEFAVADRQRKA